MRSQLAQGLVQSLAKRAAVFPLVVATLASAVQTGHAQSDQGVPVAVDPEAVPPPSLEPATDPGEGTKQSSGRSFTPMAAPVPFKNTQLGWGLMLMGGLIHRFDSDTTIKPSTGAVCGGGL